jgi:hypothetical protein
MMPPLEIIKIKEIIPANSWFYLYAYTDKGNYFIYAHRDRVSFFGTHKADDISKFQDTVTKLPAIKYFNEEKENKSKKFSDVEFKEPKDIKIHFGTCLVTKHFKGNQKADVYIDNLNMVVELHLKDADEFANTVGSDIQLS